MRPVPFIVIAAAAFLLAARAIYEPDLWWHLAQGREIAGGHLVRTNLFSFTYPDVAQPFTSWLFDLLAYLMWTAGGGVGIQTLHAALLMIAFGLVYRASRLSAAGSQGSAGPAGAAFGRPALTGGAPMEKAARAAALSVLLLGIFVIEPRAIPRPHLVSFAGLALVSLLLVRALGARSAAPLGWSVPIIAVWSNFHAESVFGVALLVLFAGAELVRPAALPRAEARRALGIAALAGVATLATPYGWGLVQYLFENASVPAVLDIAELQPPYLPAYRAFFVYVGVWTVILLSQPKELRLWEVLIGVTFTALGFRYLRLTPLVFLVTAPMLAARVAVLIAHGVDRRAVVATAIAAAAVIARISLPTLATTWRVGTDAVAPASFFSARAMELARTEGLGGPVFNSNNLGGYLAWALYPRARIFQDGRLQAYPPEHFTAIRRASRSQPEWDRLVAPVQWALLSLARPVELSGAGRFPASEWATVFWDDAVQIVVRRAGAHAGLAEARDYTLVAPGASAFVLAADLQTDRRPRLLVEARRHLLDHPDGFTAPAVLCLSGEEESCARLDRLAIERPSLAEEVRRVQRLRAQ